MNPKARIAVVILGVVAAALAAFDLAGIFPAGHLALKISGILAATIAATIAALKGGVVALLPLALVALVGSSGCASWQSTTKTSLDAASAAAETAHVALRSHYDQRCEAVARDCAKAKLPACPSLTTCQEERGKGVKALSAVQTACLLGYSAISIGDKPTATAKALEGARALTDLLAALKAQGVLP